jgi:pimeloyl-ACP methyl ester carboxylesterase
MKKSLSRITFSIITFFLLTSNLNAQKMKENNLSSINPYSDDELIKNLPGFTNHFEKVNGLQLHYVEGGSGTPLICLAGWPQTWYSFHTIAPELSKKHRVIIVDLRGMGSSDKPASGYDKKTMAKDIYDLAQKLGLKKVSLLGHDIGGMVAMSFGFNYPELTEKLIVMDGAHPSEGMMRMSMFPAKGAFKEKMDGNTPYGWWFAFNQVKELPEKILEGRFHFVLDWLFNYVMIDSGKMTQFDRAVYASVYNNPENIRTSNAWYQTFTQDIDDSKTYQSLNMPVLGIGSYIAYNSMKMSLPNFTKNCQIVEISNSGHYMNEEKPDEVLKIVSDFLSK